MKNVVELLKTDKIIRISQHEQLSSALSKLSTSHDAALVFNEAKAFVGLVNPYHCLIRNSFPGNAKLEHCLFHPPKIRSHESMEQVIRHIIGSKIHYLPVFDDHNDIMGVISSRHLLETNSTDPRFDVPIGKVLEKKKRATLTVFEDDPLSVALHLFKKEKVSKLVVVDHLFRLKGILCHYDLIHFLISPKKKPKTELKDKGGLYAQKVKKFAKTNVLLLTKSDTMAKALKMVIDKNIGSVVVIDKDKRPIGLITTRDFLELLIVSAKPIPFELIQKNVSEKSRAVVETFFKRMKQGIAHTQNLVSARLMVKEEKAGGLFEVVLALFPKSGKPKIIKKTGHKLPEVLKKVKG
ncbi:CBS domain-containing protein [Candidatus Roizmanbacteria bacterium]|nr:CBS domain-containing protein [Candidatus Roizmanbacteria bacterium]